jgi:predicted nucleic acid-binding protein
MVSKIAVDASVAIEWYVRTEIDADKALAMLHDYESNKIEFIVPCLFYYEIASASACSYPMWPLNIN